jgi:DivIVA domain-containing protein
VNERDGDRAEESVGAASAIAVPSFPSGPEPRPATDQIRNVSFHSAVRGYDRHEVDRYVERMNRTIAELEIASSPRSAVRHALDRVGEQTSGILQRARETADEIVRTARSEADETIARGKAEAEDMIAAAHAQADQLMTGADAEARARVEQAERERAALVQQGEAALAAATAQAAELRAREERRLEELRLKAEGEIRALRAEIAAIVAERGRALDEVHEVAERLDVIAGSARPIPDTQEPLPGASTD